VDKILDFFDSILSAWKSAEEVNLDERSTDYRDSEDLEKNYFATKQQFIDLLNEYEINKK